MSRIRSKDTQAELTLRRLLFKQGLRYRLHVRGLPGKPDIVFPRYKVAVFMDGDFWHGWRFHEWAHKLAPLWRAKIERNQARDVVRTAELRKLGWKVVRVWEHEVETDPVASVRKVLRALSASDAGQVRRGSKRTSRRRTRIRDTGADVRPS
jgi:DNA mismatch endonuclease (patch repair protein)